ncbi:RNA-splicing factor [Tulasnella sp. UAMH 9824]|nr:RNA-splicing factor [Tulasnella sp. UAMH 9824]
MADASTSTEPLVPFFKKRTKGKPSTARVRDTSPSATAGPSSSSTAGAGASSEVVVPTKKATSSLFVQGTSKKRKAGGANTSNAQSDDDEDGGRRGNDLDVKWSSLGSKARLEAGMELAAEDALEIEEELRRKRRRDENDGYDPDEEENKAKNGEYKGQKGYQTLIRKKQEVPKAARVGPQRNTNSTIRTVTLTDYQPDVCKDYKETGFCGFGDTCKFLHDRGTYLAGWQLDKLAEKASKQVPGADDDSDSDSDEEDIPWACFICLVTRCGHYFCSACAIKRFSKTPKCAACGQPTGGIFNRADKVIEKMREKQKAKEKNEREEEEEGPPEDEEMDVAGARSASESENDDDDD